MKFLSVQLGLYYQSYYTYSTKKLSYHHPTTTTTHPATSKASTHEAKIFTENAHIIHYHTEISIILDIINII